MHYQGWVPQLQALTVVYSWGEAATLSQCIFHSSFVLMLVGSEGQILTTLLHGESKSFWICPNPTSAPFPAVPWLQRAPDAGSPSGSRTPARSQQAGVHPQGTAHARK